jgi:hypothetical protein
MPENPKGKIGCNSGKIPSLDLSDQGLSDLCPLLQSKEKLGKITRQK